MEKMEFRALDIELNQEETKDLRISGYVNLTERRSNVLVAGKKRFQEVIKRGAFSRALEGAQAEGRDVFLLLNHDWKNPLARSSMGMSLTEDEYGLRIDAELPDTQANRDLITNMKAGLYRSMSFGFVPTDSRWSREEGMNIREVFDLRLLESSIVLNPAYPQTFVHARSLDVEIPEEEIVGDEEREAEVVVEEVVTEEVIEEVVEEKFDYTKFYKELLQLGGN